MKNNSPILVRIAILSGFALGAFALSALADWTNAPPNPPSGNTEAPINVGSILQTKIGSFNVGTESGTKVGIGTNNPTTKLDVEGGPIKAGGGLIIETRTADPTSPETGRMWLITN